ncbi:tetratricopeptide repeat protein, partial [Nautilia sp.]
MKKMLLIGIMFLEVLFSYTLIVTQKSDADKLKTVGIKCVYDSVNQNYRCVKSADLLQLKRIKNYMKKEYGIDSYIAQDNYVKNRNTLSETGNIKNVQTDNMNVSKETVINDVPIQTADIPRSGYCIQVASSPFKKGMLKLFAKYADKPLARVEKIGSNYVLRIGESRNYRDIKKLYRQINRGFIRKCDYIPKRIIKSGAAVAAEPVSDTVVIDTLIPKKSKVSVNEMYDALNSGDLIKAKKMAEKLKYTKYANDAYNVLGIVAMKMGKWDEACRYFYKTRNKKLLNTACYTDNLKKGYSVLQRNPKLSLNYFYKAKKYKNTKDIEVGIGYAYLNMKDYKKAEMIFQNLYSRYPEDKDVIKGYAIALYNLKKYDKLKSLGSRLPPKYAKELEKYDVYMDLDRANALIKEQKYDEAENILLNLYNKKPDNISVLLTLGNLYLQKDEPDKAENFFKNVLIINPDNIYALNGLKAVALKRGNYKKALEYVNRLKQLGVNEDDSEIKSMYYMQLAREALKNKNCDEAGKDINVLMNYVQKSADFYMILGDYYSVCKKDSRKAFLNYEKGYQLAKDNFDVKLKFLYSLLNYDMFTQIKIVLGTIDTDNLTPKQKKELRDFYKALYVKYASYKFNNKEYKTAIRVAQYGLNYD